MNQQYVKGCAEEDFWKQKMVGISAQGVMLSPHKEEISYRNFANPLAKL